MGGITQPLGHQLPDAPVAQLGHESDEDELEDAVHEVLVTVLVAEQIQHFLHLRNIRLSIPPGRAARKVERVEARGHEVRKLGCRPVAES